MASAVRKQAWFSLFTRGMAGGDGAITGAQWLEILLLPLLVEASCWWLSPEDPTLVGAHFPWPWLAPVLLALRYGVLPGLLSAMVLVANVALALKLGRLAGDFSTSTLFGGGLLVLVCGEFSDVWRNRNRRMDETCLYVSERLSRLTKRHLLLNLSHDRLEQEMLARPGSMRDALARLRSLTMDPKLQNETLPGSAGLLQLLSQYVHIESAALYTLDRQGDGYTLGVLVALLGEPAALSPDDALLRQALEQGSLAHIASQDVSLTRNTSQLVVAPLVAGDDELIGVLAVADIPFFSLNKENLQMMLVILGYYADNLGSAAGVMEMQARLPSVPVLYAQELLKLMRLQRKLGLDSQLVVLSFTGQRRREISSEFLRIKRGLDMVWLTYAGDVPVVAVLMPFATLSATDGFAHRVELWLVERFHGDFTAFGIHLSVIGLDAADPLGALVNVVEHPQ